MCRYLLHHHDFHHHVYQARRFSAGTVLAVLAGLLMAGCGASASTASLPNSTSNSPATPVPSAAPTSLPIVDPTQVARACHDQAHVPHPAVQVGGLYIATQASFGNLAYPRVHLADETSLKPLQVPLSGPQPTDKAPTNPSLSERSGGGFVLIVCNGSTQNHTIQDISVRLETVDPYAGQLNEWSFCADPYTRSFPTGAGCGGGPGEDEYLHATFAPDGSPGTIVATTQSPGIPSDRFGKLPWTLQPGQTILIDVGIVPPSAPGYYTFAFGLGLDGAAPVFAASSPATLLAPVVHEWTGQACTDRAMLSQIPPATTPPTFYICPVAS
jgi:hypothetical protein